jgi:hypothetical protein
MIFVPRLIRAGTMLTARGLATKKPKPAAGGGGGGGDTPFITSVGSLDGEFSIDDTLGMTFTMGGASRTATALGRYAHSGDSHTHLLTILDVSCAVLVSATVDMSGSTAGTFVYATCAATTLTAGTAYFLFSVETAASGDRWSNNGTALTTTAVATQSAASLDAGVCNAHSGNCYGPLNIKWH